MIETVTPPREGRSLLIVDDDSPFRTRLMRAFTDRGFDVRGAAEFNDAMTAARAESPELALVDLRLPGESGLELVRELRDLDPATSIVVLTGYGSIATAVESLQLGATSYLTKPVDADQILAAFDSEPRSGVRPCLPPSRWHAWSGSTSNACWPTATATSRRLLACSGSTADRCSGSC